MAREIKDPFWKLPAEIIIMIIKLNADCLTLRNLDRASPAVAHAFDQDGAYITEAVLGSSLTVQFCELARAIAVLRSGSAACDTLREYMDSHVYDNGLSEIPRLSDNLSPSLLRGLVETAVNIECLTCRCLQHLLERVTNKTKLARPHPKGNPSGRPPRRGQDAQQLKGTGPPSWVEKQRVARPLWRLQLFFDLQDAAPALTHWRTADRERLRAMHPMQFWAPRLKGSAGKKPRRELDNLTHWEHEEIACAYDCLKAMELDPTPPSPKHPLYPRRLSRLPCPGPATEAAWPAAPSPRNDQEGRACGQDSASAQKPSAGFILGRPDSTLHSVRRSSYTSWLLSSMRGSKSDFRALRRIGFGVWDLKRLLELELVSSPNIQYRPMRSLWGQLEGNRS
ncbi:MAG: hypothetical protein M1819_002702 [Sarea resinae]|nr:MAG: hypothetical protein M1819_002702 [Sarea resinae]